MNRDHPERAWDVVNRHQNVYVDTSWQSVKTVRQALDAIPLERILLDQIGRYLMMNYRLKILELLRKLVRQSKHAL